jgi:23S rRNA (cytidine1920-2'-O)/16S rRNA (cytidine1409-2'-O)-methyltransferase
MGGVARPRLDQLLFDRGLFESREKARRAVMAGLVEVEGRRVDKPGTAVSPEAVLRLVASGEPFVSRAGRKLAAALDRFGIDPADRICLDVGASTGGFTEVLLARGARRVYALDVGREQLHASLRTRPDVVVMEATDIRTIAPAQLAEAPSLVTVDVSFISLKHVLPAALATTRAGAQAVVLIKPQFEAGPRQVDKGLVRDPAIHARVCAEVEALVASLGWTVIGVMPSPITGGDGNQEFLLAAHRDATA